jgi:hypothetical protein
MPQIKEFDPNKSAASQLQGAQTQKILSPEDADRLAQAQQFVQQKNKKQQAGKQAELQKLAEEAGVVQPPTPAEAFVQDAAKTHEIYLNDGRTILLGPPTIPFVLIANDLFEGEDLTEMKEQRLMGRLRLAKIMNYIRQIDGVDMPILTAWREVEKFSTRLGDLTCDAVTEAFYTYWPLTGGTFWQDVKKNVPTVTSEPV